MDFHSSVLTLDLHSFTPASLRMSSSQILLTLSILAIQIPDDMAAVQVTKMSTSTAMGSYVGLYSEWADTSHLTDWTYAFGSANLSRMLSLY